MLSAPVQDSVCDDGTHAWQRVQRGRVSRVEIDETTG